MDNGFKPEISLLALRYCKFLTTHGRDRSVSSRGAAMGGGATPATGVARGSVADLSRKSGHLPFHFFRPALQAGNCRLFVAVPKEDLEISSAFQASEFKNRHQLISSGESQSLSPIAHQRTTCRPCEAPAHGVGLHGKEEPCFLSAPLIPAYKAGFARYTPGKRVGRLEETLKNVKDDQRGISILSLTGEGRRERKSNYLDRVRRPQAPPDRRG